MKTELQLWERFALLEILPKEGNYATLKVIRKLREDLSLSEDEMTKYEVKQEKGRVFWNMDKAKELVGIEIGDFGKDLIKSKLKELDKEQKLQEKHFGLFGKFVEE